MEGNTRSQQVEKTDSQSSHHTLAHKMLTEYLRNNKLRKTPERYAILDAVYSVSSPFDINDVWQKVERGAMKISLATIYNTMLLFEKAHILFRSNPHGRNSKFVVNTDRNMHNYLVCTNCGNVYEVPGDKIRPLVKRLKIGNFEVREMSVVIYGLCPTCVYLNKKKYKQQK